MGIFFGTDGIRGVVNEDLTYSVAFKCGNALSNSKLRPTIIIGGDTRLTRSYLTSAFASGAMSAGANIIDVGICPTAGIAYLTKTMNLDYGVVISASHNPPEYNGLKIFDTNGVKIGDKREELLERKFLHEVYNSHDELGNYKQDFSLVKKYQDFLVNCCNCSLKGLTIVIDGSNGASHKIAPAVFKQLGAKVIATHCHERGEKINHKCGSTFPETLSKSVKRYKADMGFAFDGDSDRIIACDERGNIIDGDMIIYILSKYFKEQGKLYKNTVVGTRHTNMGLEKSLNKHGIKLVRTDIGDKYVIAKMEEERLSLGGEKSGHIIIKEFSTTGDGVLTGIKIAELVKHNGKKISELCDFEIYPQINIDCKVKNKMRIINSEELQSVINSLERSLGDEYRIMVRVSGTEAKIRVMVEGTNEEKCVESAKQIELAINQINANEI